MFDNSNRIPENRYHTLALLSLTRIKGSGPYMVDIKSI